MAEQRRRPTPAEDLADIIGELVYRRRLVEQVPYWDAARHRKFRPRVLTLPPLLDALAAAAAPAGRTSDELDTGHAPPGPRPPANIDAIDRLDAIERAVTRWLNRLDLAGRDRIVDDLRHLIGAAGSMASEQLDELVIAARTWRTWAAVVTHEMTPAWSPSAPCPCCEKGSVLRIRLDVKRGYCSRCEATWDEDSIGILGRHVAEWSKGRGVVASVWAAVRRPRCRCACHGPKTPPCDVEGGCGPAHVAIGSELVTIAYPEQLVDEQEDTA
jgi:hypothetical protein